MSIFFPYKLERPQRLRKTFHTPGYKVSAYRERPRYDDYRYAGKRAGLRCAQKIDQDSDHDSTDGSEGRYRAFHQQLLVS